MSQYVETFYYKNEEREIIQKLANDPAWKKIMINADGSFGSNIYSMEGLLNSAFKLGMEAKEREIKSCLGIDNQ